MVIRVFSLNLWNLNQPLENRIQVISDHLNRLNADIVFLQEVSPELSTGKPQSTRFLTGRDNFAQSYVRTGSWNGREEGLAIISAFPVQIVESCLLPEAPNDMPRQVMMAVISINNKCLLIANTHLAFRINQDEERLIQVKAALEFIKETSTKHKCDAIIFAGDFNAEPHSPAISAVRASELELVDVFESTILRKTQFTFPSRNPFADPLLIPDRWIDYIFVSKNLSVASCNFLLNGESGEPFASDHVALTADFAFIE